MLEKNTNGIQMSSFRRTMQRSPATDVPGIRICTVLKENTSNFPLATPNAMEFCGCRPGNLHLRSVQVGTEHFLDFLLAKLGEKESAYRDP